MLLQRILVVLVIGAVLGACAGRSPNPVAVVQAHDQSMSCTQIYAEVQANNAEIQRLAKEKGWKVAQNVAAGVAGLVVPVLWFGMDWQGSASKEAAALQTRQQYLGRLALDKGCRGVPTQTASR